MQRNERNPHMSELQTLLTGLAFGESPRWHNGRLWLSDFGAQEVITVDLQGTKEIIARISGTPMGLGFLPDGRLLIVSMRDAQLLRREHDGSRLDAEDAIWYADVPGKHCVRVRQGGEIMRTVDLDLGGFACALGGPDQRTLFIMAAQYPPSSWGPEAPRTGQVITFQAPAPA